MPLNAFATSDDFADLTGLTLTDPDKTRADKLLARASTRIREATKQKISLVTDDEYTRSGTRDERISLPERPVVSVAGVSINGQAITDWYLAGNELVRGSLTFVDGLLDDGPGRRVGFGLEQQTLAITYTHGYADEDVPEICRSIALEMVKRVWFNPGGVIQETIGPDQTTYAPYAEPPRGLALTNGERQELRRFFGSNAGSVWTASAT
jgi:hypothetical protein